MTKFLLSVHVLAAILAIGPVAVAASMFPGLLRRHSGSPAVLRNLHRICRVYAGLGLLVPLFGLATASSLGVLTDAWLIASMILTAGAGLLLAFAVLPRQAGALTGLESGTDPRPTAGQLGMLTGIFNLLWAIVVILMIVRPGSTTAS